MPPEIVRRRWYQRDKHADQGQRHQQPELLQPWQRQRAPCWARSCQVGAGGLFDGIHRADILRVPGYRYLDAREPMQL
jgi:hypothetical protein